jgi:diguanylate cyclase (GGDEF)-like protein
MVDITLLLDAITERNMILAKDCNPLSGLPGNHFIQREITRRITQNMHFDVLYIDIDNFKPYNDHYGFEKGDTVLKALAGIISDVLASHDANSFNFAGHIGGDDFIVIIRPQIAIPVAEKIIDEFERLRTEFHSSDDCNQGCYRALDRHGETRTFGLLSISIGIVSTEVVKIESYPQLASIASEVKKAAKKISGSSIVRDRRMIR